MRRLGGIVLGLAFAVAGCQSGSPAGNSSLEPAATPGTSSPIASAPASEPVPTLPIAVPRESNLPTDGSCEDEESSCLGVLDPNKAYTSKLFKPSVRFTLPSAGWINQFDGSGEFPLLRLDPPGDGVFFYRDPRSMHDSVEPTVEAIATSLTSNADLKVTKPAAITLGGLRGLTLDVTTAPGSTSWDPECPVQVCVPYLRGDDRDATDPYPWHWTWGVAGPEMQRLYLLDASDGRVAVIVDSLDGETWDSLIATWDKVRPTIQLID